MAESTLHRLWEQRDRGGWRNFALAIAVLSGALIVALFSAAAAQQGRIVLAATTTVIALGLAGWVAVTIVPRLAKRTSLRWIVYQVDYKLTREGIIYLAAVFILVLAAVNTGNNMLFMILACALAGILISGVLSRAVLTGVDLHFDLPEHIFAGQPVLAEVELQNEKQMLPSFSLRVVGDPRKVHRQVRRPARRFCRSPFSSRTSRASILRDRKSKSPSRVAACIARTRSASARASLSDSSKRRAPSTRSSKSSFTRASPIPIRSTKSSR